MPNSNKEHTEYSLSKIENLSKNLDYDFNKETFCVQPFIHLSTTPNGQIKLCCRSHKIADAADTTFKDIWYSNKMNSVREAMIKGDKTKLKECANCWSMEAKGIMSLRQGQNIARLDDYHNNVSSWLEFYKGNTSTFPFQIPVLELKPSNLCNFKCRMCWPKDSTPWMADWDSVKEFYPEGDREPVENDIKRFNMNKTPLINLFEQQEKFIDEFKELAPSLDEIEFAGGEPLLDPLVFKIINILVDQDNISTENIILKYSTNLSKLNFNKKMDIIDLWKKFKQVKLTISIDGDPIRNEYIRHGADNSVLKENITIAKKELKDKIEIKATTTVQALNTPYLSETGLWIINELGCNWHTSRLQWPKHLHSNVLPIGILQDSIKKIKDIDLEKLKNQMKDEKEKYNLQTQFNNVINWLESCIENNKHKKYYEDFVNFNRVLDKNRNMDIQKSCPLVLER